MNQLKIQMNGDGDIAEFRSPVRMTPGTIGFRRCSSGRASLIVFALICLVVGVGIGAVVL